MQNNGFELRYLPLFYEELDHEVSYIAFILKNPQAAARLIDDVEKAILKRLEDGPDSFEPVKTYRKRKDVYYRIYVRNYIIYYVVLEENGRRIMEIRRFLHSREDRDKKVIK